MTDRDDAPMHIRLDPDRRGELLDELRRYSDTEFGIEFSEFQAGRLLDYMVKRLGAPIYNQAIQDSRRFVQEKLDDLEGEFYEPEGVD